MQTISYSISIVLFAAILAETMVSVRASKAVRGSRERYVALTQRRLLSWAVIVGFAVSGIVGGLAGEPFSYLSLLMAAYLLSQELKNHGDDDDWFKGRKKKIWGGVKKRLKALVRPPRASRPPVRVPSPAFG